MRWRHPLSVLSWAMVGCVVLRVSYAMPGTEIGCMVRPGQEEGGGEGRSERYQPTAPLSRAQY
eukprot:1087766-Rhodomonas_salina.2